MDPRRAAVMALAVLIVLGAALMVAYFVILHVTL